MWGMIIAILNPLGVSYIALIGVVIGNTLTFVWCAMLAWAIYFYAIYLLCTRPHDSRLVQIYLLLMGTLMLPWGVVLLITTMLVIAALTLRERAFPSIVCLSKASGLAQSA